MKRLLPILLPLALLLAACQRDSGLDPLTLTGKMFVFNYRLAYATYLVTLDESDEMLRYVAWLAGRGGDPLGALSRATRRLYRLSALGELDTLMALVEAGVEGKLSPRQMAALEEVKAALRI